MLGLTGGDVMKNRIQAQYGKTSSQNTTKYNGDNGGCTVDRLSIPQPHQVITVPTPVVGQTDSIFLDLITL